MLLPCCWNRLPLTVSQCVLGSSKNCLAQCDGMYREVCCVVDVLLLCVVWDVWGAESMLVSSSDGTSFGQFGVKI